MPVTAPPSPTAPKLPPARPPLDPSHAILITAQSIVFPTITAAPPSAPVANEAAARCDARRHQTQPPSSPLCHQNPIAADAALLGGPRRSHHVGRPAHLIRHGHHPPHRHRRPPFSSSPPSSPPASAHPATVVFSPPSSAGLSHHLRHHPLRRSTSALPSSPSISSPPRREPTASLAAFSPFTATPKSLHLRRQATMAATSEVPRLPRRCSPQAHRHCHRLLAVALSVSPPCRMLPLHLLLPCLPSLPDVFNTIIFLAGPSHLPGSSTSPPRCHPVSPVLFFIRRCSKPSTSEPAC